MAPVQEKIVDALKESSTLSMNDLVSKVQKNSEFTAIAVKAAVLPLISGQRVELTDDLKLRLVR